MAPTFDRLLKLREQVATEAIKLSTEQVQQIEKATPASASATSRAAALGSCWPRTRSLSARSVYLHSIVDTCGSYVFGFLHISKVAEAAVSALHNGVLPFYAAR